MSYQCFYVRFHPGPGFSYYWYNPTQVITRPTQLLQCAILRLNLYIIYWVLGKVSLGSNPQSCSAHPFPMCRIGVSSRFSGLLLTRTCATVWSSSPTVLTRTCATVWSSSSPVLTRAYATVWSSSPPVFSGVRVARSIHFCLMFCRSLLFLLALYYPSFYLRLLITSLVSSNL